VEAATASAAAQVLATPLVGGTVLKAPLPGTVLPHGGVLPGAATVFTQNQLGRTKASQQRTIVVTVSGAPLQHDQQPGALWFIICVHYRYLYMLNMSMHGFADGRQVVVTEGAIKSVPKELQQEVQEKLMELYRTVACVVKAA